jgi:hypothetical protein
MNALKKLLQQSSVCIVAIRMDYVAMEAVEWAIMANAFVNLS